MLPAIRKSATTNFSFNILCHRTFRRIALPIVLFRFNYNVRQNRASK